MKKLLTLLVLLLSMNSCEECNPDDINTRTFVKKTGYSLDKIILNGENIGCNIAVIVYDSCEYVFTREYERTSSITHKGNCKFCEERRQAEMKK